MYSCAYRYYLVGDRRQRYFDKVIDELETGLNHIIAISDLNWFFYVKYVEGKPILRDTWFRYKERL